jgi:hypothetical protein
VTALSSRSRDVVPSYSRARTGSTTPLPTPTTYHASPPTSLLQPAGGGQVPDQHPEGSDEGSQ